MMYSSIVISGDDMGDDGGGCGNNSDFVGALSCALRKEGGGFSRDAFVSVLEDSLVMVD